MAEQPPAPGRLALVQDFVNTRDVEAGTDELSDPDALGAWLSARSLAPSGERFTHADVQRATEVREALRTVLLGHHDEAAPDHEAIETLNHAARNARLVVAFDDGGGAALAPDAAGIEGALGRLLAIVHDATIDGTWQRMKACRWDTCVWAFFDHSRNRSRSWCSMEVCGNRAKARTHRQRHRAGVSPS